MDTKFATSFAPYTPPPDEHQPLPTSASSSAPNVKTGNGNNRASNTWLPNSGHSQPPVSYGGAAGESYQSGGLPSFGSSTLGGRNAIVGFGGGAGMDEERGGVSNMWETRFGLRVDVLAAVAYLGGPVTALILLILETSNDYVRFHAYQSALLTTPLLLLRLFAGLVGFWSFLQFLLSAALVVCALGMAVQAYRDASTGGLARFRLPYIGKLADRWVGEE